MSSKKDMRRNDLVIPYVDSVKEKNDGDISSTIGTTLPMAAMFTRNKIIGWASLVFSLQTWLAETPEQTRKAGTPGYLSVGMALMAIVVTYLPLFLPPPPGRNPPTGTEASAAAPSS